MDHRVVELVVCVLCTDFANTVIWESWRADDMNPDAAKRIGFITHPRPDNRWFVPYSVAAPIDTRWGDSSLVQAELVLLSEAVSRFPNARQFLVVSGDTVPIRTKEDFFEYFLNEEAKEVSVLTYSSDVCPVRSTDADELRRLGLAKLYNGHQFIALCRKHAEFLVSPEGRRSVLGLDAVRYHAPRYTGNFNPDEVYIQTVLRNTFPRAEFYNGRFVDFLPDGYHAKTLTLPEFETLYQHCLHTSTLYCIRKVCIQTQWEIFQFLGGEPGVVNFP